MSIESVMPSNHLILYVPFCSCLQSFPTSGSFQMSRLFTSGGQNNEASASASVLPVNIQDWSPLGRTGWISFQSKGLSRVFSNTTVQRHQFFCTQLSLYSHIHTWLLEKPALTRRTEQRSSPTPPTGAPLNPCSEVWRCLKPLTVHLASDTASPPGGLSTPGPTALSPQSSKKD